MAGDGHPMPPVDVGPPHPYSGGHNQGPVESEKPYADEGPAGDDGKSGMFRTLPNLSIVKKIIFNFQTLQQEIKMISR